LQMSDTSVWFVAPKFDLASSRAVHCIEFAPAGRRINRHVKDNNNRNGEDDEINVPTNQASR